MAKADKIKCKHCGGTAVIILTEGKYIVYCYDCQSEEPLKTYNVK